MPGKFSSGYEKFGFNACLILVILILVCLAWSNRFIQDDAFISFRYADNLIGGKGLVWNEGERVEGYTNFLWTLIMCIPLHLEIDPAAFSFIIGVLFFACCLVYTFKLSSLVLDSRILGLITIALLGTNYTFSSYATGGLETSLQTFLFAACFFVFLRAKSANEWKTGTVVLLSVLSALAMLTRPDSGLLVVLILPSCLFFLGKEKIPGSKKSVKILCLVLPLTVISVSWVVWKVSYYGDVLPNSFYIKAAAASTRRGVYYLYLFFISYWLVPFPLLGIAVLRRLLRKENLGIIVMLALIVLWSIYTVKIGGDFMEFRFVVPMMPFIFIVIVWLTFRSVNQRTVQVVLTLLVLLGSLHHALTFDQYMNTRNVDSIESLQGWIRDKDKNWEEVGKVLGASFGHSPEVTIATTAAGAIPFYSRLRTIDMHGLNDKWITENGIPFSNRPGHKIICTFDYLIERKVNILIGHPRMRPHEESTIYNIDLLRKIGLADPAQIPADSRVLEIPIDANWKLVTLYLTRSPTVDDVIRKNNWNVRLIPGR